MQIKSKLSCNFKFTRVAIKITITSVSEDVKNRTLIHSWWECKFPLWKTMCQFLKRLNIQFPYDSQILGIYVHTHIEEMEHVHTKPFTHLFIAALFVKAPE